MDNSRIQRRLLHLSSVRLRTLREALRLSDLRKEQGFVGGYRSGKDAGIASLLTSFLNRRETERKSRPTEIIAVHSHGHSDHTAGDSELGDLARVIPPKVQALQQAFGIAKWPEDPGKLDLGDRELDVIAIPGHDDVSIAIYDRKTGIMLTGDTVYPGRLYVRNWQAFKTSISRLVVWTRSRPVAHVLGAHIEQTRTPFRDYPVGTTYQPGEHALELSRGNILEIDDALSRAGEKPTEIVLRDVTIVPRKPSPPPFVPVSFNVPMLHETSKYKFVPLGPEPGSA